MSHDIRVSFDVILDVVTPLNIKALGEELMEVLRKHGAVTIVSSEVKNTGD